ncbi:MAG: DUF86 domain-containing protein [Saprospirales bacterium]|jgi:uncharacterized protein with HEPN domain|nr:DUF86 domain-containing protein [Saprospirales bacterium]MBK8923229.1 DUF86 domain-containing protein [Saprospirales bacterium]
MTVKARKYLSDILYSIELIEQFLSPTPSFHKYSNDLKTKAAVERYLTIIGEAVHLFSKEDSVGNQLSSAAQIISFRNRLVHAYDAIDDAIVWAAVKKGLPKLKKEVIALLGTP